MVTDEKLEHLLKTDPAFVERLICFHTLVKYRFIEPAARELNLKPAELIHQMQFLERQVGERLFEDLSAGFESPEGHA